jgi:hypothetical protein
MSDGFRSKELLKSGAFAIAEAVGCKNYFVGPCR